MRPESFLRDRNLKRPAWRGLSIVVLGWGLVLLVGCRAPTEIPDDAARADERRERLAESLQSALEHVRSSALADGECLPGATAAVAFPDELVVEVATGYSNVDDEIAMRPEHVMPAGSVGKVFVAATVLRLVSEGHFELETPISTWFGDEDWFDRLPNAESITVRHLLQHASGLIDHAFESEEFVAAIGALIGSGDPEAYLPPAQLVEYVLDRDPLFPAGDGYNYTDTGFILLGMVIEEASGSSYYDLLSATILEPLELSRTSPQNRRDPRHLAQGYAVEGQALGLPEEVVGPDGALVFNPLIEWTGGGLYSSPADLARFLLALLEGEVVDAAALEEMTTVNPASVAAGGAGAYGLGLGRRENADLGVSYGHSGFFPGYNARALYFVEDRFALALQVNCDSANLDRHFPVLVGAVTDVLRSDVDEEPTDAQ